MAKGKRGKRRPRSTSEPTVVVCRGGECGNRWKHPEVDHQQQLRELRAGTGEHATTVVSRCLDACEHANVVVLVPAADDGADGVDPVWIGEVNDAETARQIVEWVEAGGPAHAPAPVLCDIRSFAPSRRNRNELSVELERS
ncbi:hypothetical protein BKD30_04585 [Tersicoccus phoenicis]|uniref:(2Fe-2S) ferredoxin domain-containing protein n=1 Tax=Tersicoccus phoenicis TaxID=554083 RepID=A0A1R1LGK1_9MICC|nr:hypothetical protein [Tersicoccus phoenicis]OMH26671.1 hypothetical protein BKD30_04585 [Tersicoccus phoenicis]